MFQTKRLQTKEDWETFKALMPAKWREASPSSRLVAIGATDDAHRPIALILGEYSPDFLEMNVAHFSFPHEDRQLARELLIQIQQEASQVDTQYFFLIYPKEGSETPVLKEILTENGWQTRPFMLRCLYNGLTFDMPWVHQDYPYPEGFEEFPWSQLTSIERQAIETQLAQKAISPTIFPFDEESKTEPLNSLGLRFQGRVVGWMITHRTAPDTICYRALYVEKGLQFHELATKLIFNSIKLHMKARTPWALLEIPFLHTKKSWQRFVEQQLAPYADQVTHLFQAWKIKDK